MSGRQRLPVLQTPARRAAGKVQFENGRYVITLPGGDPTWNEQMDLIRSLPRADRAYDTIRRVWTVAAVHADWVRGMAKQYRWIIAATASMGTGPTPAADGPSAVVFAPKPGTGWTLVRAPADPELGRQLVAAGAWSPQDKAWLVRRDRVMDLVLAANRRHRVVVLGETEISNQIREGLSMLALSRAITPSGEFELCRVGRQLFGFQEAGVEYVSRAGGRCIIAGPTGSGKTTVALASLEHMGGWPAIVIGPKNAKPVWQRDAKLVVPWRTVVVHKGRTPPAPGLLDEAADLTVINYDMVGSCPACEGTGPVHNDTWAHRLSDERWRAVITDEGHRIGNPDTKRTRAIVAAAGRARGPVMRLHLSATPVRNNRKEMHPQLAAIGRNFGSANELGGDDQLARRLRMVCMWRPDQKDVLASLGIDAEHTEPVYDRIIVEGTPSVMAEYRAAESDIVTYLQKKAREKAIQMGRDPEDAAVAAAMRVDAGAAFVAIGVLLDIAARAKLDAIREWISDFRAGGEPFLGFAFNRWMLDALAAAAGDAPQINGDVSETERADIMDRFQSGKVDAVICQLQAASEALTLTRAWHTLHVQLAWSPATHDQADGRCNWRVNDPHGIISHWMICADTIEEWVIELHAAKRNEMRIATDADADGPGGSGSVYMDVFNRLLDRALAEATGPAIRPDHDDNRDTP